jgi:A/G-specific adenine glycosylase
VPLPLITGDPAVFAAALLDWFARAAADLPWRAARDAYRIWLSEIMLQQTQVATVIPYYARFLDAFPTVEALAAAPLDDVLKRWEGLGYYSRARNLHRAAQRIVSAHGGRLPSDPRALEALPGIGRYTANAIASIAYGAHVPVLDGNVIRVLARLCDIAEDVSAPATRRRLWALAETLIAHVPPGAAGDYNQALMELGREVCIARAPRCAGCPVSAHCTALARGTQAARPVRAPKPQTPHYDVAAAVIRDGDDRLLIAQRPPDGLLGGLWEFPAGRAAPGESLEACLARALREKLGISARIGAPICVVRHAFTHFRITLHAFDCQGAEGTPHPLAYAACRWAPLDALDAFAFARADRKVIDHLRDAPRRLF